MWESDLKESWTLKNWCFWTVVLEKTLESPLDCREIKPINPKGNQSWIFIRRTGAEAEAPILWPPDPKNWLIGKDPNAGKDWRQAEKGMTEDAMVNGITDSMDMSLGRLRELVKNKEVWRAAVCEIAKSQTRLSDWTELMYKVHEKVFNMANHSVQFSRSVVSDSATPRIAACQASLSITISRSSFKLTSIEWVMPSSHLILCRPLLLRNANKNHNEISPHSCQYGYPQKEYK